MPVEYEVVDGALRINCTNWAIAPSIEDSDATMAVVIDKLLESRDADRIVLIEARENEYDVEQTKMLREVAEAYNKILNVEKIISLKNLGPPQAEKLFTKRLSDLQFLVFELLRKDPIGAYLQIVKMVNMNKVLEGTAPLEQKPSFTQYLDNALIPIKNILEQCTLIQKSLPILQNYQLGNRDIYRDLFSPTVRPNFMLTRFMLSIPKGAVLVEKYSVENAKIEIYRLPTKTRFLYHVTPKEFVLSDEKYAILDSARRYLSSHRPTEAETVEPDKSRDLFKNLGRDLIHDIARSTGVKLESVEIEELADILARYTAGYGVLEILLADDKLQDLFVNSPIGQTPIYIIHADYEECETNLIPTMEDAESWATRFRLYSGRPLDESNPVLDTELIVPGGRARVAAITKNLSPSGLAFAFRRHREKPWTFPLLIKTKTFNPLYAGLMDFIIDGGRTMLVAGSRGSGKTSILGALMLEIMPKFRQIVIEDTLEIPVTSIRKLGFNIEQMKSRSVITRVETELPADEALRTSLRLGDSVLIIGEVRSVESLALFEAMRIGGLSNVVAGTIHGETAYGVFDRVVHDLGVTPTSFKALDIVTISNMLKSPDGLHRFRRVTELTEVRKNWKTDPSDEGGFVNLMEYSAKEDTLKPTDVLLEGESQVLNEISRRVRDWRGQWDAVWDNIQLRAKIKETMLDFAEKSNKPNLLEAESVVESNSMFHIISEKVKQEVGSLDSKMIYDKWMEWYKKKIS